LGRGLRWVRGEIEQSLERVRHALAAVLDDEASTDRLLPAIKDVNEVARVCQMTRCAGGQLLAASMARALTHAVDGAARDRDALLGDVVSASFRLAHYVHVVVDGLPDHPLALVDETNALRAGCGDNAWHPAQALAESWLLQSTLAPLTDGDQARSEAAYAAQAADVVPALKSALAALTRDPAHAKAWQVFAQACGSLATPAPARAQAHLWQLGRSLGGLGPRLPAATRPRVGELLRRQVALAVNVGRAETSRLETNARVTLASWALLLVSLDRNGQFSERLLAPLGIDRETLSPARRKLVAEALKRPAEDSLSAVLRALLQDFGELREDVETAHGGGLRDAAARSDISDRFRRLAAAVRGLGFDDISAQLRTLESDFASLASADREDAGWDELAETLLRAEQRLNDRVLRRQSSAEAELSAEARASILRECLINLTRMKSEVDGLLTSGRAEHAQNAITQTRQLAGALEVFGDTRLVEPFQQLQQVMARDDFVDLMRSTALVAAFADAVASAEYVLEALRDVDPDVAVESERFAGYVHTFTEQVRAGAPAPDVAADVPDDTTAAVADEVDDDLREIFIDEARDVLAELGRLSAGSGIDKDRRGDVRRAFHTLKGSGRMVGAADIGEFGWAVENLLNRCLEGQFEFSGPVEKLVQDAIEALPSIIDRFQQRASAAELTAPLIAQSEALIAGTDGEGHEDLRQTFLQDAQELREQLQAVATDAPVANDVTHLWHTLRGGAAAISAAPLASMLAAAESLSHQQAVRGLSPDPALHGEALSQLEAALDALHRDDGLPGGLDDLAVRLRAAAHALAAAGDEGDDAGDDAELRLIFCTEAQELLDEAERLLSALDEHPQDRESAGELQRVFHTLKGSARMAAARGLADLATQLDAQAKPLTAATEVTADTRQYFRAGVERAWTLVDAYQAGRDDAADFTPPAAATLPESPEQESPVTAAPSVPVDEPATAVESPVASDMVASAAASPAAPHSDVDVELLDIFLPECDELLESIDGAMAAAASAPAPTTLDALFRALHTLKGGARMCGLYALGEEAHALETTVEHLRREGRGLGADDVSALQRAVDQLHSLRAAAAQMTPDAPGGVPGDEQGAAAGIRLLDAPADAALDDEPQKAPASASESRGTETARVPVSRLDGLLSEVGEISMFRSRLEQQMVGMAGQLRELDQAIERLRGQVRNLEQATDAQIQARTQGLQQEHAEGDRYEAEFDPLEMDRYTRMQELTRSITETIGDLGSVHRSLREAVGESEAMVLQQGRLSTTMQEGLLTTLAVPFSQYQARLGRVVRQVADEQGKPVALSLDGAETELDRNVLERIVPALEHLLRNSVVHGIEAAAERTARNKAAEGKIRIAVARDNNRVVLRLSDDGGGLNYARIREEAVRRNLLAADADIDGNRLAQFIFEPGFSTAQEVSLTAGRGVGMDVVAAEIRQLGGSIDIDSRDGEGCTFTVRLPFSLAVTQALQVQVADADFIVPLSAISGVARVAAADVRAALLAERPFSYGGVSYEVHPLARVLGSAATTEEMVPEGGYVPVLFLQVGGESGGGRRFAAVVDHLLGTREVVAKSVGRHVASVPGIAGASIQPDGRVVVILDVADLILDAEKRALRGEMPARAEAAVREPLVMVIDDSITMRRVAERMLTRSGFRVALARDGADGVAQLQTVRPDAVLLDIEMPRMDGFEVASFIRHDARLESLPIIMITSRSGEKHRERASKLGVNDYLIKPYQENQLLSALRKQLDTDEASA
ncbi:MAG: Hpt domain-containing protein, partial [Oceanococcaceae bacterium]